MERRYAQDADGDAMRLLNLALIALCAAGTVWAQGRIMGGPPRGGVSAGPVGQGFGNVIYPSGVAPKYGIVAPIYSNSTSYAHRLGTVVSGKLPHDMLPGHGRPGYSPPIVGTIPVFVGGYGYGYAPSQQQTVTIVNVPPPAPVMVINQNYTPERANPVMRDYANAELPQTVTPSVQTVQAPIPSNPEGQPIGGKLSREAAAETPTVYLIALREGTVYSAYAYWVEGDTLHYITTKHAHNRATLDLVDVKLSEQLNHERNIEFRLR
jgi:hypothetical protein